MKKLSMTVNGSKKEVLIEEGRVMLSDVLRDTLGLTGTKVGCGAGQCGSCTVVMNGEAVTSCTVPAEKAEGADILTIEGVAKDGELHPIQKALIDAHAIQCGFCTPGIVMRLHALLSKSTDISDEDLEGHLNKHLCRCTGYETISDGAKLAREMMSANK